MTGSCQADSLAPRARRFSYNRRLRPAAGLAGARAKDPAMVRWVAMAALVLGLVAPGAQAQFDVPDSWRSVAQRYDRENARRGDRREERREDRREDRRRADRDRDQREWLTPDEHRELNRDLQRANREFYRQRRDNR
jgi:hypothetical protein